MQPLPHENNAKSLKIVGRGSIYIMFMGQMYTVCSQERIRLETISEKGPGHELTSVNTLLSSGAKKMASNCAHPSHEWKLLIVYRKRCKQLGMRQCNPISVRENHQGTTVGNHWHYCMGKCKPSSIILKALGKKEAV